MTGGIVFALTFLAALGSGLMAGLFFVFSAFMMTALARLPAGQGMAAMQSINVAILNPAFGAAFFGTAILSVALAAVAAFRWSDAGMACCWPAVSFISSASSPSRSSSTCL